MHRELLKFAALPLIVALVGPANAQTDYGSLLGVFVLAIAAHRTTANGAFWGLLSGMVVVAAVEATTDISFIWYNVVGAFVVVVVGLTISLLQPTRQS